MSRADKTKAAYRSALRRLEHGKPIHPRLVGRSLRINVSTVCLEAGLSRNPLYVQHREVLDEIHEAAVRQAEQTRSTKNRAASDRRSRRGATRDRRAAELTAQLATSRSENLTLLFRLQQAEQQLRARRHSGAEIRTQETLAGTVTVAHQAVD
jgi:hypothetical protein